LIGFFLSASAVGPILGLGQDCGIGLPYSDKGPLTPA
jgi:hypothetical protein